MAKTPEQFYKDWNLKGEDIDKTAGYQCVDGWKIFLRWCGFKDYNAMGYTSTGWAEGIWTHPNAQVLKYFDKVTDYKKLQDGDWVLWGKNPACFPKSHVAMYYKGGLFGMNQNASYFTLRMWNSDFKYMIGAFRWKKWVKQKGDNKTMWDGKKYKENGKLVVGQKYIDGYWYFFNPKTYEYVTGFYTIPAEYNSGSAKKVYYDSKGHMLYGQQYISKNWYCFDKSTGAMFTGVKTLSTAYNSSGSKKVVYKADGKMIHGQDVYNNVTYLCDNNTGKLQASWDGKNLKVY